MRILVVGAGAMGLLFGGRLISGGHDVVFIDVDPVTIEALNSDGVTVRDQESEATHQATATLAADASGVADVVIFFTKVFHTRGAVESIKHLVGPATVALSLQNGLGNDEVLAPYFSRDNCVIGVTSYPADRVSLTTVESTAAGSVELGSVIPGELPSAKASFVARLLSDAGFAATASPDVRIPIWEKVIFNSVVNTVGAATGITVGRTGSDPRARSLAEAVLAEAFGVAESAGVDVSRERVHHALLRAYTEHSTHRTSMTVDVERGSLTEIDAIGGAVEQVGASHGVPTPVLSALCSVVRLRTC